MSEVTGDRLFELYSDFHHQALWLPDKAPSLANDPRYSIRLANINTWDQATGRNKLNANVTVS